MFNSRASWQALDSCWVLGGGEVVVPASNYLTGAIALKANTLLRFEKGIGGKGIFLANSQKAKLHDLQVTGYAGPLLNLSNVTGSGLAGAAAIDPPKLPDPVPTPTQPYQLG